MKKTYNYWKNQLPTVLSTDLSNDRAQRIQELDFHLVMADACPNPVLAFFTKFILSLLARIIIHEELNPNPQTSSEHSQQGFDYHQALLMAFRERNPQKAGDDRTHGISRILHDEY